MDPGLAEVELVSGKFKAIYLVYLEQKFILYRVESVQVNMYFTYRALPTL